MVIVTHVQRVPVFSNQRGQHRGNEGGRCSVTRDVREIQTREPRAQGKVVQEIAAQEL
jgi:hypothetical protein